MLFYLTQIDSDDIISTAPMIAAMLDPRHKHLAFLTPARRIAANGKLLELALAEDGSSTTRPTTRAQANTPVQGVAPQRCASAMVRLLGANYTTPSTDDVEKEVDSFLKDPAPHVDSSPTQWWKGNAARFPRLAKVAQRFLSIPATSVASERVFSAAGLTVNKLRSRLTPEHVDMLLFLNKNA